MTYKWSTVLRWALFDFGPILEFARNRCVPLKVWSILIVIPFSYQLLFICTRFLLLGKHCNLSYYNLGMYCKFWKWSPVVQSSRIWGFLSFSAKQQFTLMPKKLGMKVWKPIATKYFVSNYHKMKCWWPEQLFWAQRNPVVKSTLWYWQLCFFIYWILHLNCLKSVTCCTFEEILIFIPVTIPQQFLFYVEKIVNFQFLYFS